MFRAALAVPLTVLGIALAAGTAHAAPVPAGPPTGASVTATEAYSDSVSDITAMFGSFAIPVNGTDTQVPNGSVIQFAAVSSLGYHVQWSQIGVAVLLQQLARPAHAPAGHASQRHHRHFHG